MFLGCALNRDPVPGLVGPYIDNASLDNPDPDAERAIYNGVQSDSNCSVVLGIFEPELVIPQETRSTDGEGEVAEPETDIGEEMRLCEGDAVQVGGNGVVRCVLKV